MNRLQRRSSYTFSAEFGSIFLYATFFVIAYLFSLILLGAYTDGDQIAYGAYYSAIRDATLLEAYDMQPRFIGSSEVVYPLVAWLGSIFNIDKLLYVSFFNATLSTLVLSICIRYRTGALFTFLMLTNFYLIVLLTGAERLKFSYIFLCLGMLFSGKTSLPMILLSFLSHFQNAFLIASLVVRYFVTSILYIRKKNRAQSIEILIILFIVAIFLGGLTASLFIYFLEPLLQKFFGYYESGYDEFVFLQFGVLLTISLYVARDRVVIFLSMTPLIVGIYLLGGSRLNMVAVTLVIFFLIEQKRTRHPLVYIIMGYLSYKSIDFIYKVWAFGDGFASSG